MLAFKVPKRCHVVKHCGGMSGNILSMQLSNMSLVLLMTLHQGEASNCCKCR
jgi:hypothetical protein